MIRKMFDQSKQNVSIEHKDKPIVVIIKGNPDRAPKVQKNADALYKKLEDIFVRKGYKVEFDDGSPFTSPNEKAKIWIGFSRGADLLDYAPKEILTYELKMKSSGKRYSGTLEQQRNKIAADPDHYLLSKQDLEFFGSIS